jgi:hypothetical protein
VIPTPAFDRIAKWSSAHLSFVQIGCNRSARAALPTIPHQTQARAWLEMSIGAQE